MVLASLSRPLPSDVVETRCVFRARLNKAFLYELFLPKRIMFRVCINYLGFGFLNFFFLRFFFAFDFPTSFLPLDAFFCRDERGGERKRRPSPDDDDDDDEAEKKKNQPPFFFVVFFV